MGRDRGIQENIVLRGEKSSLIFFFIIIFFLKTGEDMKVMNGVVLLSQTSTDRCWAELQYNTA